MRNMIRTTKEGATIAIGIPFAFLALGAAAAVMAVAAVVTEWMDRLAR